MSINWYATVNLTHIDVVCADGIDSTHGNVLFVAGDGRLHQQSHLNLINYAYLFVYAALLYGVLLFLFYPRCAVYRTSSIQNRGMSVFYGYEITAKSWNQWKTQLQAVQDARCILSNTPRTTYGDREFIEFLEYLINRYIGEENRTIMMFTIGEGRHALASNQQEKVQDPDILLQLLITATENRQFELEEVMLTFREAGGTGTGAPQAAESEIRVSFSSEPGRYLQTNQTVPSDQEKE